MSTLMAQAATATVMAGLCAACLYPYPRPLAPLLVYNASPSLPVGLYRSVPKDRLERGAVVRLALPASMQPVLARWGYPDHPRAQFLIKQIAGLPGQTVCRQGGRIVVDGVVWGPVHPVDHLGHPLPQALSEQTCERLGPESYFVATRAEASLDSRYFGPVARQAILQALQPVWVSSAAQAGADASSARQADIGIQTRTPRHRMQRQRQPLSNE